MSYFIDLSIFRRNRNLTLLFIGQFVSFFGTMITSVALPYQIYMQTHSTLMVGLLSLAQLIPLAITALIGGVFADRYHRRILLLWAESILAMGCLLFAWNANQLTPSIVLLFVIAALMAAFNGLHRPALDSITQQIVEKKDYPALGAIRVFKGSFCMIAGPAAGGLLIAHFGIVITFLVDFATFLISLGALLLMSHIPAPTRMIDESSLASLKTGVRYALSRQELLGTYLVDFIAMVFGMPQALFPAIALKFGGAKALGLLYAAPAVGAFFISLFSGGAYKIKRHGMAVAIAAIGWGIAIIFFGLTKHFYLALGFLALAGAFDGVSAIFRTIIWNETIPQHLRGRLAGIEMISYLSGPRLGDTEAGLVAALFGITFSIVSGGVLCVAGVGLCCYFLPKFWYYHSSLLHVKLDESG